MFISVHNYSGQMNHQNLDNFHLLDFFECAVKCGYRVYVNELYLFRIMT